MKTLKLITALCILNFAFCIYSNAQKLNSNEILSVRPSTIIQVPKIDNSKPLQYKNIAGGHNPFMEEGEEREDSNKRTSNPNPRIVNQQEGNNRSNARLADDCPNPPVVQTNFEGNPRTPFYLPPVGYYASECNIAISNAGKIVSISNGWMYYFNANGSLVFSDSLYHFGNSLIDCHVLYDPKTDRFIFATESGYTDFTSTFQVSGTTIAFSKTNDPMDGWNFYQIPFTDFHDNSVADYPLIAISDSEVFMTLNYLKGTDKYKHVEIIQINKSDGYSGAAAISLQKYDAPLSGSTKGTMIPAQGGSTTYGHNMYFLMASENGNSSNKYYVYEITNTIASGQAVLNRYGTVSSNISYSGCGVAYQPGGIKLLNLNAPHDDYVQDAFYENGLIQFCQHTKVNGKASAYIGRIGGIPNNLTCTAQTISDPNLYLSYPSIVYAGNSSTDNSAIIGMEHTGPNTYPGLSAAFVNSAFEVSSLVTVKAGNDTINGLWGDYSGICKRYNQPDEFWFEGQYGSTSDNKINWIAKLQSPAPCSNRIAAQEFTHNLTITPNPFSNSTTISFSLPQTQNVSLQIFDVNGKLVSTLADKIFEAGEHQIEFNVEKFNAGIYFLKMSAGTPSEQSGKF